MRRQHILVDILEIIEMENSALEKLALNRERPLSEASIEARAVLQVINTLYELDKANTQDPAIDITTNPEGTNVWKELYDRYKLTEGYKLTKLIDDLNVIDTRDEIDTKEETKKEDRDFMYKWIREKSGK